jgi:hypothetical protein
VPIWRARFSSLVAGSTPSADRRQLVLRSYRCGPGGDRSTDLPQTGNRALPVWGVNRSYAYMGNLGSAFGRVGLGSSSVSARSALAVAADWPRVWSAQSPSAAIRTVVVNLVRLHRIRVSMAWSLPSERSTGGY